MPKKKIAYVSGTRADLGLMAPVLSAIAKSDLLALRTYATGIHLMPEFGETVQEMRRQFPETEEIQATFPSDDPQGMARFYATFTQALTEELMANPPDLMLVLGDRVDQFAVAGVCTYLGIPMAQLHGGDQSRTVDDLSRNAITKLVQLHLPCTEVSAERIRTMGEPASRIHVVGAPALDVALNAPLPSREAICATVGLNPSQPFILVLQHAVTESWEVAAEEMRTTLQAVASFNMPTVVIYPNADAGGRAMIKVIEEYKNDSKFYLIKNLPHPEFMALEREAAVWVGNSSAGVIESASFKTPVVNVGRRQEGRLHAENVIHAPNNQEAIRAAIHRALHDDAFRASLQNVTNPWGSGDTGPRVRRILEELDLTNDFRNKH